MLFRSEKALTISQLPYSVDEIKKMFALSNERFERDLFHVSGEISRISIAIGFAMNKAIFCYPWLNTHDVGVFVDYDIVKTLRKAGKIILIPTCPRSLKTDLKRCFDEIIDFHAFGKPYFDMHPSERKKIKRIKGI